MEALGRRLLQRFQRDLPLVPDPFRRMADAVGSTEAQVLQALQELQAVGLLSRVGAVFAPGRVGASTLVAMQVPTEDVEAIAAAVSAYPEVNHNYEREHRWNLWFVLTGADRSALDRVLEELRARFGLPLMDLPLEQEFHLDLGFALP